MPKPERKPPSARPRTPKSRRRRSYTPLSEALSQPLTFAYLSALDLIFLKSGSRRGKDKPDVVALLESLSHR
jgi:hypothetical protein